MGDDETRSTRRPNGRLAACGPCHSRKVACDHVYPICNRCRKRNQANLCVYGAQSSSSSSRLETESPAVSHRKRPRLSVGEAETGQELIEPLSHTPSNVTSVNSANTVNSAGSANSVSKAASHSGYFGLMGHTAVFEEAKTSLSLLDAAYSNPNNIANDTAQKKTVVQADISFRELPLPIRNACLLVLQCLPGQSNEQIVFHDGPASDAGGWTDVAVDRIVRSLQETFSELEDRSEQGLEAVAERICNNTAQPFSDECSDPNRWLDQFSGSNLRWESIGLLWTYLERISDVVDSLRTRRLDWAKGKQSVKTARTCLSYCIDISRHFTEGNDLLLDMCRRKVALDAVNDGEATMLSWGSQGLTVSMMTYLGLHDQVSDASYKPSLCSENKRRIAAQIFTSDKMIVSFSGRPPLISRRYCSIPLPLDIGDEDLASDEATLMRVVAMLDDQGWNTDGALHPATLIRARYLIAVIQDELIEIALSNGTAVALDYLHTIKSRQMVTAAGFPDSLKFHQQELITPDVDIQGQYVKLFTQLLHLQNIFFAERLLLRHGSPDEGDLLVTSFTMVSLVLNFWIHKDRFSDIHMQRNFPWMVLAYGAPGGGILCMELLRPTFTGFHPKDANLSRSRIVQQLSLLVSFFDWACLSDPNESLCANCRDVIQRVLDHHLNATTTEPVVGNEYIDWGYLHQPDFGFQLMDTYEWLRDDKQY